MKKSEDYDWEARLVRQVKSSILTKFYTVLTPDEYDYDEKLKLFSEDEERGFIVEVSPLILKNDNSLFSDYIALLIADLDDDLMSEEYFSMIDQEVCIYAIVISSSNFMKSFQELLSKLIPVYDDIVNDLSNQVTTSDFPYPEYKQEELIEYFSRIKSICTGDYIPYYAKVRYNDILIKQFHKSIYGVSMDSYPSTLDAWVDIKLIEQAVRNRAMYKSDLYHETIRDGLNIAKIAPKPSIITTKHAVALLSSDIMKDCYNIVDPIMGYSGKMIASILLGKKYTGFYDYGLDNNYDVRLAESRMILDWIGTGFNDLRNRIDNVYIKSYNEMCEMEKRGFKDTEEFDCLVCEVPYWNKKLDAKQYTDSVIDELMAKFRNCKKYVFIIKDTKKYNEYIDKTINDKSHLYMYHRRILVIDK